MYAILLQHLAGGGISRGWEDKKDVVLYYQTQLNRSSCASNMPNTTYSKQQQNSPQKSAWHERFFQCNASQLTSLQIMRLLLASKFNFKAAHSLVELKLRMHYPTSTMPRVTEL